MDEQPKRFRFSLQTLLIGVTVACVWLGWEHHVSQERHRVRRWVESHGSSFFHSDRYRLNIFDDWREAEVTVPDSFSDEDLEEVKRTFPEKWCHIYRPRDRQPK